MYCAYITTIKEIHKHFNADRLQYCEIFGNMDSIIFPPKIRSYFLKNYIFSKNQE